MGQIVIGVDPDAEKHGVATYVGGALTALKMLSCVGLVDEINHLGDMALVSIEDVMSNQFVYGRNRQGNKSAQNKIAMHIGRCQQAQVELMRWLDWYEIPYVLHKPQRGNWAKDKSQFERVTGWTGQSNEDTRAAAFFGFLALTKN